jgi:ankyrin repeat protein
VSLPETLDETYTRILDSIPTENKQSAVRILQLLTYSERPLSVAEVVDAIAVDITEKPHFDPKYRMPDPDEILIYCSSLVIMVPISVDFYDKPVYGEDSDDDENEEPDNIYIDEQYSSEENMGTMFVLQLAHFSVKEYLTSGRFRGPLSSEFHETTARLSIAVVCLSYLLHFDCYLCRRKIVARFPFAKYCAGNWLHHTAAVESESSELTTLLENLFYHNQAAFRVCYRIYNPDTVSVMMWIIEKGRPQPAPALYYASLGNLYNTVKFLLDHGADVNATGGFHGYALHVASKQGHERIARLLIERGAHVSTFHYRNRNALMEALSNGHTRIARLLLEHGADVNARTYLGESTLAIAAASPYEARHKEALQLLLDNGAYDTRGSRHFSALELASKRGYYKTVEFLLERCVDFYAQNIRFVTGALKAASRGRQKHILKLLLNKGADMYTTCCVRKVFHTSIRLGRQEIAETLLEEAYPVLKSSISREYGTIANFCAFSGRTDLLRIIDKDCETDIYASEPYGRTPLHLAAKGGHMETFEYLITHGADPTVLDVKGDGILCYAAIGGNLEMANAILNRKLGSERYSIHWSPLHWACRAGHAEVVELFLEKGPRSHLVATDGLEGQWSPLSVAIYAGNRHMLQILPATSQSLLGINNCGPEIWFDRNFGTCHGCWLVGSR